MRGKKGIVSVVKLLRNRPFGEWNVVYYEPAKTTLAQITTHLRTGGCKRATQILGTVAKGEGPHCTVANPIIAAGDMVQIQITLPKGSKGKAKVTLPKGWRMASQTKLRAGINRIDVQSPKAAGRGKVTLKTTVQVGETTREFSPSAEIVGRVR